MSTTVRTVLIHVLIYAGIYSNTMGYDATITNICAVETGIMLEWIPGGESVVKWAPDLSTPFADLSATLPSGQGSYTDTVHGNNNQCFYRVEIQSPAGMVLIPAGTNSGTDPDYGTYSLTVAAFYMDVTEITKAQWDAVYNWAIAHDYEFDNAGSGKAADHPVHSVSWYDCVKWCNARSQMDGKTPCYTVGGSTYKTGESDPDCNFSANGYRLPTSEEWEYAARGGQSGKRFPWGDTITHSQANYYSVDGLSYDISPTRSYHPLYYDGIAPSTSPSGSFATNGYGLHDMAGNIAEWCWDLNGGDRNPNDRCIRGGDWSLFANALQCGSEFFRYPGNNLNQNGLRTVCQ